MLRPFQTPTHSKRTYRELKLLMYLNHPDAQVCTNHSLVFFKHHLYFSCWRLYNYWMYLHLRKILTIFKHCTLKKYFRLMKMFIFILLYRYFVLSFADYDLDRVIKRNLPFTEEHIRQIIYSLLRGLKVQILLCLSISI